LPELGGLATLHPIVVHFAIALAIAGVVLRLVSLTGRLPFTSPAAATLLLVAAVAAGIAARSGLDAHDPSERVPGARTAVQEHEEWGKRAAWVMGGVGILELLALGLGRFGKARYVQIASAVVGVGAVLCLFEAAEHGGRLVYSYAGGVGLQNKDPADVGRLLLAGLYHQAQVDRKEGHSDQAAALVDLAARRFSGDVEVQLFAAESQLLDRKDPAAAIAALGAIKVPADTPRLRLRHAFLLADALTASGQKDAARATLQSLHSEFPDNPRLKRKLDELGGS
jgi:uncharacterized membrane protein